MSSSFLLQNLKAPCQVHVVKTCYKICVKDSTALSPLPAAQIASLARFIPWWILLSLPATSWRGERVWVSIFFNLLASRPLLTLKSLFNREILLLSWGRILLGFLGLEPKTMRDVLREGVSGLHWKTSCITSASDSPMTSQHSL